MVHPLLKQISLKTLTRIDVGLEGNWSPTVMTVWDKKKGFLGFEGVVMQHTVLKPSIEIYFKDAWLGLHCCRAEPVGMVFDQNAAKEIIAYVEAQFTMGDQH